MRKKSLSFDPNLDQMTLRQGTLHFQQVDKLSFQTTQAATHRRDLSTFRAVDSYDSCAATGCCLSEKKAQYLDQTYESYGPGQRCFCFKSRAFTCQSLHTCVHFRTFSYSILGQSISDRIRSHANTTMCLIIFIDVHLCILYSFRDLYDSIRLYIHFTYLSSFFVDLPLWGFPYMAVIKNGWLMMDKSY